MPERIFRGGFRAIRVGKDTCIMHSYGPWGSPVACGKKQRENGVVPCGKRQVASGKRKSKCNLFALHNVAAAALAIRHSWQPGGHGGWQTTERCDRLGDKRGEQGTRHTAQGRQRMWHVQRRQPWEDEARHNPKQTTHTNPETNFCYRPHSSCSISFSFSFVLSFSFSFGFLRLVALMLGQVGLGLGFKLGTAHLPGWLGCNYVTHKMFVLHILHCNPALKIKLNTLFICCCFAVSLETFRIKRGKRKRKIGEGQS